MLIRSNTVHMYVSLLNSYIILLFLRGHRLHFFNDMVFLSMEIAFVLVCSTESDCCVFLGLHSLVKYWFNLLIVKYMYHLSLVRFDNNFCFSKKV